MQTAFKNGWCSKSSAASSCLLFWLEVVIAFTSAGSALAMGSGADFLPQPVITDPTMIAEPKTL